VPFVCYLFQIFKSRLCLFICGCTVALFYVIELIQIKLGGIQYFKIGWNYIDILFLNLNGCLILYEYLNDFEVQIGVELKSIFIQLVQIFIFILLFTKMLFFWRVYGSFGKLSKLVWLVLVDMRPFLVLFFTLIMVFAVMYKILEVSFNLRDYVEVPELFVLIL